MDSWGSYQDLLRCVGWWGLMEECVRLPNGRCKGSQDLLSTVVHCDGRNTKDIQFTIVNTEFRLTVVRPEDLPKRRPVLSSGSGWSPKPDRIQMNKDALPWSYN